VEKKTNVCFSCLCGVLVMALEAVDDDTREKATSPLLLPSCFHVSVNDDNCLSAVLRCCDGNNTTVTVRTCYETASKVLNAPVIAVINTFTNTNYTSTVIIQLGCFAKSYQINFNL